EIETEIDRADYVIVLLSPDVNRPATASQSPSFVINEINYAMRANKTLVPIIAVANTKLPIQLAGRQYKDVSGLKTDEAKVAAIIGELAKLAKVPLPPTGNGGAGLPKNEEARTQITVAWIGAGGVILAALIGAFALLWVNKDNDPAQTPPPPPSITATFAP